MLDKKPTEEQLREIEAFMGQIGYKEAEGKTYKDQKERIKHLHQLLDRPIRVCGMVIKPCSGAMNFSRSNFLPL